MLDGRVLGASQVEYKPFGKPPLKREIQHKCHLCSHSCRAKPLNPHSSPGPCNMCYMCYILHAKPHFQKERQGQLSTGPHGRCDGHRAKKAQVRSELTSAAWETLVIHTQRLAGSWQGEHAEG